MRRFLFPALIMIVAFAYSQFSGETAQPPVIVAGEDGDPLTAFSDSDATMNAAMAEAQSTVLLFVTNTFDTNGNGSPNGTIKVAFDTPEGPEIIWVGSLQTDGTNGFRGILVNQPNYMEGLNLGDPVQFTTNMVRDWSLSLPDGTLFGNYTTRVMIPYIDTDTATYLNSVLSPDPVPADWR